MEVWQIVQAENAPPQINPCLTIALLNPDVTILYTPEGDYRASTGGEKFIRFKVGTQTYDAATFVRKMGRKNRPENVRLPN